MNMLVRDVHCEGTVLGWSVAVHMRVSVRMRRFGLRHGNGIRSFNLVMRV
jgi:hypothetical protein